MFDTSKWSESLLRISSDDYNEHWFKIWKIITLCALYTQICIVIPNLIVYRVMHADEAFFSQIPYFEKHPVLGFVISVLNFLVIGVGYLGFESMLHIYKNCINRAPIRDLALAVADISSGRSIGRPKFRIFFFSKSVQSFEERYVRYYKSQRKRIIELKHTESELATLQKRKEKLEEEGARLNLEVSSTLLLIDDPKTLAEYKRKFGEAKDIKTVREYIAEIREHSQSSQKTATRQNNKMNALLQALLQDSNKNGLCESVIEIVSEVNSGPSAKRKIALLKKAISLQRAFNKKRDEERSTE